MWQDITIEKLRDIPKNDIQKAQTTHLCIKQHKRKSNDLFYFLHIFLCSMTWGQIDGCSNSIQIRSHSRQYSRLRKEIIRIATIRDKFHTTSVCKSEIAQKKEFWFLILDFQSYCHWTLKNCNNLKSIKVCHWKRIGSYFFLYFSHMEASQFKTKPFLRSNPISNQWERKLLWHLFQCKRSKNFKYFPITHYWDKGYNIGFFWWYY